MDCSGVGWLEADFFCGGGGGQGLVGLVIGGNGCWRYQLQFQFSSGGSERGVVHGGSMLRASFSLCLLHSLEIEGIHW